MVVGAAAGAMGSLIQGFMPRLFGDKQITIEIVSRDARDTVSLKLPGVRITVQARGGRGWEKRQDRPNNQAGSEGQFELTGECWKRS